MSFVSGASAARRLVLGAALTLAGCDPAPEPPMDPVFVPVGDDWLIRHRFVATDWSAPDSTMARR